MVKWFHLLLFLLLFLGIFAELAVQEAAVKEADPLYQREYGDLRTVKSRHQMLESSSSSFTNSSINIPTAELSALSDLYYATGGDDWRWNISVFHGIAWQFGPNANPCVDNWQGLNCSFPFPYQYYHISSITLQVHNLVGTLPESIGNFSKLIYLNLNYNLGLTGSLPTALSKIHSLVTLDVGQTNIGGTIPQSYGYFPHLLSMVIDKCRLRGHIPHTMLNMTQLRTLNLEDNLLSGPIYNDFNTLIQLSTFYLSGNLFTGTIPSNVGRMPNLEVLHLSDNLLDGTIPHSLTTLEHLVGLELDGNFLTGSVPSDMNRLTKLGLLNLANNLLSGPIPDSIGDLTLMTFTSFENNLFTGTIPRSFGNLVLVTNLYLQYNNLGGTIPASLGNLNKLIFFYMNHNMLHGKIPKTFSNLTTLTSLFLQNNQLTGEIGGIFNYSTQKEITTIELSDNGFYGSIPPEIFLIKRLKTFTAVSNCFEGHLPLTICRNDSQLHTLVMDGLRAARSCREAILPGISNAYVLTDNIQRGIPDCIFRNKYLRTLHLSGNGLTGTLPDNIDLSDDLVDVSLSHNALTGSIPLSFQTKRWYALDLSYNRFSGTLIKAYAPPTINITYFTNLTEDEFGLYASVEMRNNRLSGQIPVVLRDLYNISVLQGNIFECSIDQSQLPRHDPGAATYQCGSNAFDISYYIWLSVSVFVFGGTFLALWCRNRISESWGLETIARYYDKWMHHIEYSPQRDSVASESGRDANPLLAYKYVIHVCEEVGQMSLYCTIFVLVVLMPVYVGVSHYYGTHEYEYAWTVSAAFLSGAVALSLLLVFYIILLLGYFIMFSLRLQKYLRELNSYFIYEVMNDDASISGTGFMRVSWKKKAWVYTVFLAANFSFVFGINILYVYVVLYASASVQILAQMMLSLFKVLWNNFCVVYLVRWANAYLAEHLDDQSKSKQSGFFAIQLFAALFNYIAIPMLVVGAISPDCYSNVITGAEAVDSTFLFEECEVFSAINGCILTFPREATTSYNPPFTYSYQCSSSLITFYAPTYVYLCFIVIFLNPLSELLAYRLHCRRVPGTWLAGQLDYWVPLLLQDLDPATEKDKVPYDIFNPYLDANLLVVTVMSYLGVLLTFGVVFPPLAPAMLVSIVCVTLNSKLLVGRFLTNAIAQNLGKYVAIIEKECKGAGSVPKLRQCARLLIVFCCFFYTPFLFDTLGDAEGLSSSLWVIFFLPCIGVCGVYGKYVFNKMFPKTLLSPSERNSTITKVRDSQFFGFEMGSFSSKSFSGSFGGGSAGGGSMSSAGRISHTINHDQQQQNQHASGASSPKISHIIGSKKQGAAGSSSATSAVESEVAGSSSSHNGIQFTENVLYSNAARNV
jgi:Leucine-rich repeat (LRR) protein